MGRIGEDVVEQCRRVLGDSGWSCNEWNIVGSEEGVDEISCRGMRVMVEKVKVEITENVAGFVL
jgi:hypothetical protein